jgi:hypothetical protein
MVVRLWVPLTHWLRARNWNLAASGACLTASRVANRVAVSTPLRIESLAWAVVSVVVIFVCLLERGLPVVAVLRCDQFVGSARWPPFLVAVVGQAVAGRRSPGIGRAASAAASVSMAALSCFCSPVNAGTAG